MPVHQNFRPGRPFVLPPSPARSTDSQFDTTTPAKEVLVMEDTSAATAPAAPSFPFESEAADVFVRPILRPRRPNSDDNNNKNAVISTGREPPQLEPAVQQQQEDALEDMWVIRRCDAFDEDDC